MTADHSVDSLTEAERGFLRDLAWRTVAAAAGEAPPPDPAALAATAGVDLAPRLQRPCGAFVTLHQGNRLRGCIGHIEGRLPLVETVLLNAQAAARHDPRFPPVVAAELAGLSLEVSVLTPLRTVAGPHEIVVGRHGVLLEQRGRQAVFLPQVAVEQGWDVHETLRQLALKAGLQADAWRSGATFRVFQADVF